MAATDEMTFEDRIKRREVKEKKLDTEMNNMISEFKVKMETRFVEQDRKLIELDRKLERIVNT